MLLDPGSWASFCTIALGLGARHALDADHIAVIDGVARRNALVRPMTARLGGALFSCGHSVVVLIAAGVAQSLAGQWRTPAWLDVGGTAISAAVLMVLGVLNLATALSARSDDRVVVPIGWKSRLVPIGRGDHPAAIVAIGALFAISWDTIGVAAVLGIAAAAFGRLPSALLVAGCFGAGMIVMGGMSSLWIAHLVRSASRRARAASGIMTAVIGGINVAIAMLAIASLASGALSGWIERSHAWLSGAVIASSAVAFAIAMRVTRRRAATVADG